MKLRLCIIFILLFALSTQALAKEPEFMVTWRANTSSPVWYEGKAFPSYESSVDVSFELIEQNGANTGKFINLSTKEIRWYLGDNLVKRKDGLQSLRINNSEYPGKEIAVRISIPDYYDAELQKTYHINHYEYIPITFPQVIGDYHQFSNSVLPGEELLVSVYPFFFNVDNNGALRVAWRVGNEEVEVNPSEKFGLRVQIPSQANVNTRFPINVEVSGSQSLFSTATFFNQFIIK